MGWLVHKRSFFAYGKRVRYFNWIAFSYINILFSGLFASCTHGLLIDKKIITPWNLSVLTLTTSGIACLINPLGDSYIFLVISMVAFGMSTTVSMSLDMILVRKIVSVQAIKKGFTLLTMFTTVGYIAGPPLAGKLQSTKCNYISQSYLLIN